jgi:hypothetical protein
VEENLFHRIWIFARRFRRAWNRRLFAALSLFAEIAARLVPARFIAARAAGSLRWRLLLAPRRLDAAESAAEFFNLALVGELLALGDFDEFEHFVEVVNHLLERLGNFSREFNGLADGGGLGGAKIGGFDPRLGPLRFRAAFGPAFARFVALRLLARRFGGTGWLRFRRRSNFCGGFRCRRFRRLGFMRGKFGGHVGMRLSEAAGGFGFVFCVLVMFPGLGGGGGRLDGFRRG